MLLRPILVFLLLGVAVSGTAQTNRVVFVGDSITYGCNWAATLGNSNIVNQGVCGDTTRDILARLESVADPQARAYFIMAGINDLSRGIPSDETVSNIRKIIRALEQTSPDSDIVLQSILPVNSWMRPFPFETSRVKNVNEELRRIADAKTRVAFLDLYPSFLDDNGRLKSDFTYDGLHLSAAGYEVWADILRREWFPKTAMSVVE
jgi:lysophospholipase L1-like esterase